MFIIPDGECCPVCACIGLDCALPACDGGVEPIYDASSCCPSCPEPSCAGVECRPANSCPPGFGWGKPAGACCADCIPDPSLVGCVDIACSDPVCPIGYTSAASQGGCCYDCVPDPLYCNSDADCTIADRPRSCCGCPEAISLRSLDDDPCWSSVAAPREIPADCYPEVVCDALCGACAPPGEAQCVAHRCTEVL